MRNHMVPRNYSLSLFLCKEMGGQTNRLFAAMQPNGLACRNSMGDYVGLAVILGRTGKLRYQAL